MEFCIKPPFSMTERQIEKPGELHRRNILKSSYMKFYPIWSRVVDKWLRTDRQTAGRTDGRTDEAATTCSSSGEHNRTIKLVLVTTRGGGNFDHGAIIRRTFLKVY